MGLESPIVSSYIAGLIVLSAALFALAYAPALRAVPSLVSSYAKADLAKRLAAAMIDLALVATCVLLYLDWHSGAFIVGGAVYSVVRDAIQGRSLGKLLAGLVVINVESGEPIALTASIRRNLIFIVPGANVAAAFLEAATAVRDPQGHRLGDKLARTQVVDGLGAREIVKFGREWWRAFLADLRPFAGRPDREPVDVEPCGGMLVIGR